MKRGDLLILLVVAVLGAMGLYIYHFSPAPGAGAEIVIQVDGEDRFTFPLYQPGREQLVEVEGKLGKTLVMLGEDKVRVVHSDCPDKICVHMGWISRPATPIACLPNRVIVRIRGQAGPMDDYDFKTR